MHDFTNDLKIIDVTQKLKLDNNGNVVFNFWKIHGQACYLTLARDKQYYHWILEKEFSSQVKKMVRDLVKEYEKERG
ncbi:MAG: hypothetical protein R2784_11475 [Saprospiraceae bacterium]